MSARCCSPFAPWDVQLGIDGRERAIIPGDHGEALSLFDTFTPDDPTYSGQYQQTTLDGSATATATPAQVFIIRKTEEEVRP